MSVLIQLIPDIKYIVEECDKILDLNQLYQDIFEKECCKKYSDYNYDNIVSKYNSTNTNISENNKEFNDENNKLVVYKKITLKNHKDNITKKNSINENIKDDLNENENKNENVNGNENANGNENVNENKNENVNKNVNENVNVNESNKYKDNLNSEKKPNINVNTNKNNYYINNEKKKIKKYLNKLIKKLYKYIIIKLHPDRNKYKKTYEIELYNEFILFYENKDLLKMVLLYNNLNINKINFSNNDIICLENEKKIKINVINKIKNSIHWKWCTQLNNRQKNIVKKNYSNILRNLNI